MSLGVERSPLLAGTGKHCSEGWEVIGIYPKALAIDAAVKDCENRPHILTAISSFALTS